MHLTKVQKSEVEQIISSMKCPKDFACFHSDFERLCPVKDVGLNHRVCMGTAKDRVCKFTVPFEGDYLCGCPLRSYIATRLEAPSRCDQGSVR